MRTISTVPGHRRACHRGVTGGQLVQCSALWCSSPDLGNLAVIKALSTSIRAPAISKATVKEDPSRLQDEIEAIRRRKKSFFMQNSGLIKLSTIHSFKGLEARTVFCILSPGDEPEMVYTAITRAQRNLMVFDAPTSKYRSFFTAHMTVGDALREIA